MRKTLLVLLTVLGFVSCDPTHQIRLENQTSNPIVVICSPQIDTNTEESKTELFDANGTTYEKIVLDSGQTIPIGDVVGYTPTIHDIRLDFLEIHIESDTMRLIGKKSILSSVQKVGRLDWRLIIKDK